MNAEQYLNTNNNYKKQEEDFEEAPTFEENMEQIDWTKDAYNQPRAFTMKNIRDLFFGLMNQSRAQ